MSILNEMSKEELIAYIARNSFVISLPKKSEILFIRWQKKIKELEIERSRQLDDLRSIHCKERDEYAKRFNTSTDYKERLELIEKMKPYEDAIRKHFEDSRKIRGEEKACNALYDSIDVERKKEQGKEKA